MIVLISHAYFKNALMIVCTCFYHNFMIVLSFKTNMNDNNKKINKQSLFNLILLISLILLDLKLLITIQYYFDLVSLNFIFYLT